MELVYDPRARCTSLAGRIAGETVRVFMIVATLGYSRHHFVAPFRHERQSAWLDGLELAFGHFAEVRHEVLLDPVFPDRARPSRRVAGLVGILRRSSWLAWLV
jgi:transposase